MSLKYNFLLTVFTYNDIYINLHELSFNINNYETSFWDCYEASLWRALQPFRKYLLNYYESKIPFITLVFSHVAIKVILVFSHVAIKVILVFSHVAINVILVFSHVAIKVMLVFSHVANKVILVFSHVAIKVLLVFSHVANKVILVFSHVAIKVILICQVLYNDIRIVSIALK